MLSWNRPAAAIKTIEQLEGIEMDITAVQEIRWTGTGNQKIRKSVVFYSGSPNNRHEFGTGFVIRERMMGSVMDFKPVNERICYMRLRGKLYNISMLSVHAPTEEKDELTKDIFYDQLETLLSTLPKQDATLLLGDFNAKIGKEEAFRPNIGKYSLHEQCNDNGLRLVDFATSNNFLIKSTMFDHKNIHKQTWVSNDGITRNQIDHVLINARRGSGITDVRSLRGLDADSDHFLVRAKFRERISNIRNTRPEKIPKWNTEALKDTKRIVEYQTTLETALGSITDQNNVDALWEVIKNSVTRSIETTVGKRTSTKKKNWFDDECERVLELRNQTRQRMLRDPNEQNTQKYRESRRKARQTVKAKKRAHEENTLKELESNGMNNRTRIFFQEVKNIRNGFRPRVGTILRNDEDNLITSEAEVMETWKRYFDRLLNVQTGEDRRERIYLTAEPLLEEPAVDEISRAIRKLKNNKAPGNDTISAECLKNGGESLVRALYQLICQIWKEEEIPTSWKESIIVPIHKKGDKMCCTNYRGISLINTGYKVFSVMLLERLTACVEYQIGDYQCGFRKNRSTVDQIFTIGQLMEKCWEYNKTLHQLFIDFKQAYDSIIRVELWNAMAELGIPKKLINLTKACVEGSTSAVRVEGKLSTFFTINSGLKQGDALSPLLFNIVLESSVRRANTETLLFRNRGPRIILAFADDIDIVGNTTIDVKEEFMNLENTAKEVGLRINENKTKYMATTRTERRDRIGQNVTMDQYNFERVQHFKYLGVTITSDNNITQEINNRIQGGNRCCYALQKIMKSKNVSRRTKVRIYHSVVRPIMTYACEAWTMTKQNENRLRIAERRILRGIYGPVKDNTTQQYRMRTNRELEELYSQPDIVKIIKSQRLRWAGHVKRQGQRVVRLVWEEVPEGKRPLGRPRMRWRDNIAADLRTMNIERAEELMMDRDKWRQIVKSAKTHPGL